MAQNDSPNTVWFSHAPVPVSLPGNTAPSLESQMVEQKLQPHSSTPVPVQPELISRPDWSQRTSDLLKAISTATHENPELERLFHLLITGAFAVVITAIAAITTVFIILACRVDLNLAPLANPINPLLAMGGLGGTTLTIAVATNGVRRWKTSRTIRKKTRRKDTNSPGRTSTEGGDAISDHEI